MAAAIMSCRKRGAAALLEDLHATAALRSPISKRFRRLSPPISAEAAAPEAEEPIVKLLEIFPDLDPQLLAATLEALGNNLDTAITRLNEQSETERRLDPAPITDSAVDGTLPSNGPGWVDLFVGEMTSASSIDDARVRASRMLELLEKSISASARAEAECTFQKENDMLKQKAEVLLHDNSVLRKGVAILHERQKDYDAKSQEIEQLKKIVSRYQEQVHNLELNNYALSMHLRQAQQSNSLPGRFNPDVF